MSLRHSKDVASSAIAVVFCFWVATSTGKFKTTSTPLQAPVCLLYQTSLWWNCYNKTLPPPLPMPGTMTSNVFPYSSGYQWFLGNGSTGVPCQCSTQAPSCSRVHLWVIPQWVCLYHIDQLFLQVYPHSVSLLVFIAPSSSNALAADNFMSPGTSGKQMAYCN